MSASRPVHRGVQEQKQHVQKDNQRGCPRHALGDSLKLLRGRFSPRRTRTRRRTVRVVVVVVITARSKRKHHLLLRRREHVARYIRLSLSKRTTNLPENQSAKLLFSFKSALRFRRCCSVQKKVLLLVRGRKTPKSELTVV